MRDYPVSEALGPLPLLPLEAPREIAVDAVEIAEELRLLGTDAIDNAMKADMVTLPPGQRREGKRFSADPLPQLPDTAHTGRASVQMPRAVVQTQADTAGGLVEIEMLAAPAACRALEPRTAQLIPHHGHPAIVDQKIGSVCAGQVYPVPAPKLGDRSIADQSADAVQPSRIDPGPVLYDKVLRSMATSGRLDQHHERTRRSS